MIFDRKLTRIVANYCGAASLAIAVGFASTAIFAQAPPVHPPGTMTGLSLDLDVPESTPFEEHPRISLADPNIQQPQQSISNFAQRGTAPNDMLSLGPLDHVQFTTTWLGGDDLGFTDFELTWERAFPTISKYHLLTLKPGFGLHLVDGPAGPGRPDLPPQLYDFFTDIKYMHPFSHLFAVELGLTPGLYTDFEKDAGDGFRLGARVVGYYTHSPALRFAFGVAFLDRDDVDFLPLGGVIWTPNPNIRYELVVPRPKLAHRFRQCCGCEDWWYLAGEFGGGSWSVQRTTGMQDAANYYDLRLAVGWERKTKAGPTAMLEIAYVFNRRLEFRNGGPIFEPDDAIMIRGGIGF